MGSFYIFFVGVAVLAVAIFVGFFGRLPAFRQTFVGHLSKLIWVRMPALIHRLDLRLSGGRVIPSLSRLNDRLTNDKHPIVTIFFLGLITGGAFLFLLFAGHRLSTWQLVMTGLLLPWPYYFTFLCSQTNGQLQIVPESHTDRLSDYPFDRVMFHPGTICRTCKFEKPARSKHCSICKVCVARADHHCVWVNNCIGRANYKYFLLLLASTTVLLLHAVYLAYAVLSPLVLADRFWSHPPNPLYPTDREAQLSMYERTIGYALDWLSLAILRGGIPVAGIGLICVLVWPLPLGLLAYHIYLIQAGTTTNESAKWSDIADIIHDRDLYYAPLRQNARRLAVEPAHLKLSGPDHNYPFRQWPASPRLIAVAAEHHPELAYHSDDPDAVIHPHMAPPQQPLYDNLIQRPWKQVESISTLENLYDIGLVDNMVDILLH